MALSCPAHYPRQPATILDDQPGALVTPRLDGRLFRTGLPFQFFTEGFTYPDDAVTVWLPGQKMALNNVLWPYPPNIYNTARGDVT